MLAPSKLRTGVLIGHGMLALCLGLAFFYLRTTMIAPLFEAIAVATAFLLSAAALILAAITDWFAAFSAGLKSAHCFTFYLLAGIAFALAGFFVGYYPLVKMRWLVVFAAVHALAFSISAFVFAIKEKQDSQKRRTMYLFGTISILFSGTMGALVGYMDDLSATVVLGLYLCFIGVKMLFFAWDLRHRTVGAHAIIDGKSMGVSSDGPSYRNMVEERPLHPKA